MTSKKDELPTSAPWARPGGRDCLEIAPEGLDVYYDLIKLHLYD
jgi:hypothetical protein